jgi:hypothetical protein
MTAPTKSMCWAKSAGTWPCLLWQTPVCAAVHLPHHAAAGVPKARSLR